MVVLKSQHKLSVLVSPCLLDTQISQSTPQQTLPTTFYKNVNASFSSVSLNPDRDICAKESTFEGCLGSNFSITMIMGLIE